jgi:hypothetical protein
MPHAETTRCYTIFESALGIVVIQLTLTLDWAFNRVSPGSGVLDARFPEKSRLLHRLSRRLRDLI